MVKLIINSPKTGLTVLLKYMMESNHDPWDIPSNRCMALTRSPVNYKQISACKEEGLPGFNQKLSCSLTIHSRKAQTFIRIDEMFVSVGMR